MMSNDILEQSENRNPVEAIQGEIEKAEHAPKKVGLLSVKSANDWINDSLALPDPKTYWHGLITQGENTVIFASSGVGKSILAVQIGEEIAQEEPGTKVCHLDLELSIKQFQGRSTGDGQIHVFPSNFIRAEIDPEFIVGADLESEILESIEVAAQQGTEFFIVDNLTFICNDAEKGVTAGEFMMKLIRLKKRYNLTTIVIAHTPKRRGYDPITQNDLAGSAKLINFFDAGIALARSARDSNLRYLKQVKVRSSECRYDFDNVMVLDLQRVDGILRFVIQGFEKEEAHLKHGNPADDVDEVLEVLRLVKAGKTYREAAAELGISLGKVQRLLKKAEERNITLESEDSVSLVSPVSGSIQPIQDLELDLSDHYEEDLPYDV